MIIAVFLIAVISCSILAFIIGQSFGSRGTSAYYVMVISYMSAYMQDKISHDEFLEICVAARNKTEESLRENKILQP